MIAPSPAIDWKLITVYKFKATLLIPVEAISWGKLDLCINTIALKKTVGKQAIRFYLINTDQFDQMHLLINIYFWLFEMIIAS